MAERFFDNKSALRQNKTSFVNALAGRAKQR